MNYYNEYDKNAAAWLRELIKDGLIAEGEVDERSICDVQPSDLRGYNQVHLFAGVGGWSLACRLAGIPDDEPIWTGSCPCPPFSTAAKRKSCPVCAGVSPLPCPRRTGYFICCDCGHAWFADARHLWPEMWRLLAECRPATVIGEQVASDDGRAWLAGIRATLEILGYAAGAVDFCAAGAGAPHLRQRLFWSAERLGGAAVGNHRDNRAVADAAGERRTGLDPLLRAEDHGRNGTQEILEVAWSGDGGGVDNANSPRRNREECDPEGIARDETRMRVPDAGCADRRLANPHGRQPRNGELQPGGEHRLIEEDGGVGRLGNADDARSQGWRERGDSPEQWAARAAGVDIWSGTYWHLCSDEKIRRVKPGIFPLAHGFPSRVGLLRGSGNAIVAQAAAKFIRAHREAREETRTAADHGSRVVSPILEVEW